MSLITNEWRLKLGAIVLSLVLLGAVAFSQVQTNHLTVSIAYENLPSNLVLLSPPTQIDVSVSGPAEVFPLNPSSVSVSADLTHVKKGNDQQVSFKVHVSDSRLSAATPPSIDVDVDQLQTVQLPVELRGAVGALGWAIDQSNSDAQCGNSTQACAVTVTGPLSVTNGLAAFVTVTTPIAADTTDLPGQPVTFEQSSQPVDLNKIQTLPHITWDPTTVTAHIVAKTTTASRQLVLIDAPPIRQPPTGYRITKITIEPALVLITGPSDALANAGDTITLDAVDLGNSTSDTSFMVNIHYPAGTTGSAKTARITYSISPNPNVSPSASPSP